MAIDVKEINENTFQISWDENDPLESVLNTWTEEDFINCLKDACNEILGEKNVF